MMKRLSMIILVFLIVISSVGCNSKISSISLEQQKAVNNCIEYIQNSSMEWKDHIDTKIINIKNVKDNTWRYIQHEDTPIEKDDIDTTDWVITIGDTSDHAYLTLVCDSSTCKVIGYMPMK